MRADGVVTYYFIQHRDSREGWCASDLSHFLFDGLSFSEHSGVVGNRRRKLLEPQSASSDLWQEFGIHGFVDIHDAEAVLRELVVAQPHRHMRIVRRSIMQQTEPIKVKRGRTHA